MSKLPAILGLISVALLPGYSPAQSYIWKEAELNSDKPPLFQVPEPRQDALSGGRWLTLDIEADKLPSDGLTLPIEIPIEQFGSFELWARLAHDSQCSPFRWRIDDNPWTDVGNQRNALDLQAISKQHLIAWYNLGTVKLPAGTRRFEIQIPKPTSGRVRFGLDCVVFSRTPFLPNGRFKPGLDWRTPADRAAESVIFELPAVSDKNPRQRVELGGAWQVARFDEAVPPPDRLGPPAALPDLKALPWRAIRIPGELAKEYPEWSLCHRLIYRCRLRVPPAKGRTYQLRFPNNAMISTVFCNGKRVGHSDLPHLPFTCDLTGAIAGQDTQEIVVVLKDWHYAFPAFSEERRLDFLSIAQILDRKSRPDFPLSQHHPVGILAVPELLGLSPVSLADLEVQSKWSPTGVKASVTVNHPAMQSQKVQIRQRILSEDAEILQAIPEKGIPLSAAGATPTHVDFFWQSPRIWRPDFPKQSVWETELRIDGKLADKMQMPFGFREWSLSRNAFQINGQPLRLRSLTAPSLAENPRNPGEMAYLSGSIAEAILEQADQQGRIIRRGEYANGPVTAGDLVVNGQIQTPWFDRWRKQLFAQVRNERHHPSILCWSIGRAITAAEPKENSEKWRQLVEKELQLAIDGIRQLDPTRTVVIEGGNGHYLPELPVVSLQSSRIDPREWPRDKVLLVEMRGQLPDSIGAAVGAMTLTQMRAEVAERRSELLRWHAVAGYDVPHASTAATTDTQISVLCREAESQFPAGKTVTRHLKVCNDSLTSAAVTVHWLLLTRNTAEAHQVRGKRGFQLAAGNAEEFPIELLCPEPADAYFVLTCEVEGQEVFRRVRSAQIIRP